VIDMTAASTSPEPVHTEPVRIEPVRIDEVQPVADLRGAPLPTEATLRRRSNPAFQLTRFVAFNLRILRMAAKGHH
jgi:hypothetical protein